MNKKIVFCALPLLFLGLSGAQAAYSQGQQRVEVAFVLDTTGSMGDLIDGAKRKIWSIATTIVDSNPNADIAMALVAYRDRGDDYVVKSMPLSTDVQGLYGKLIKLEAAGGGDDPESVNEALDKAISGLQWSSGENVKHIVFLVGDAPPHMDYRQERQYPEILKAAAGKHIVVNAVQAGDMPETTPIWKEIAQFGHGRYISIPQDGGEVVIVVTPFDDDILHMQEELDGSIVPYGSDGQKSELNKKMVAKAAAPDSVKIDNSGFYSKRKIAREVVTGRGDLVADAANAGLDVSSIAENELPDDLKAIPAQQRKRWLIEKMQSRKLLEDKMASLIAKRDAYVFEQRKKKVATKNIDSFDSVVEETLKSQLN
jgi:post-segregation antitoxin (ccd killing protein)